LPLSACRFESDHGYHLNNMKAKGKSIVEVEIDQEEAKRITVRTLRDIFGWSDGAYIDVNGNLIVEHDAHTSHSFVNNVEIIRKANEDDFALRRIIHELSRAARH
jgi:hypothetical protein